MTLRFHNTLSNQTEEFVSLNKNKALIYTCGPTVYDKAHIGNWASYIFWDILVRILMANNYEVNRVMNITDVGHLTSDADEGEDKLEKRASHESKTAWQIAEFYTTDFIDGMKQLGLIAPQYLAKATDYIPDQVELIRKLKEKGFTYQINDGIYFDTSKFPTYADFARLDIKSLKAGARIEYNTKKQNLSDFALWKFTPKNTKRDMEWETPKELLECSEWNIANDKTTAASSQIPNSNSHKMGFPGWHLECSAIALSILGETLDIHTGGIDHIPIHHTNEIAQSEAATGKKFCNYWLHNDFLKVNGTKISKSLGNVFTLDDLYKKGYSAMDFRMFVLQGYYRKEGNFTFDGLDAARNRLHNWRNISALRHQTHDTIEDDSSKNHSNTIPSYAISGTIVETVNNDLGTPEALKIIDDGFSEVINTSLPRINQHSLIQFLNTIDSILGLQLIDSTPDITDKAKKMIIERNSARDSKDWGKADKLRNQLIDMGIVLRDAKNETVWEYLK